MPKRFLNSNMSNLAIYEARLWLLSNQAKINKTYNNALVANIKYNNSVEKKNISVN